MATLNTGRNLGGVPSQRTAFDPSLLNRPVQPALGAFLDRGLQGFQQERAFQAQQAEREAARERAERLANLREGELKLQKQKTQMQLDELKLAREAQNAANEGLLSQFETAPVMGLSEMAADGGELEISMAEAPSAVRLPGMPRPALPDIQVPVEGVERFSTTPNMRSAEFTMPTDAELTDPTRGLLDIQVAQPVGDDISISGRGVQRGALSDIAAGDEVTTEVGRRPLTDMEIRERFADRPAGEQVAALRAAGVLSDEKTLSALDQARVDTERARLRSVIAQAQDREKNIDEAEARINKIKADTDLTNQKIEDLKNKSLSEMTEAEKIEFGDISNVATRNGYTVNEFMDLPANERRALILEYKSTGTSRSDSSGDDLAELVKVAFGGPSEQQSTQTQASTTSPTSPRNSLTNLSGADILEAEGL